MELSQKECKILKEYLMRSLQQPQRLNLINKSKKEESKCRKNGSKKRKRNYKMKKEKKSMKN